MEHRVDAVRRGGEAFLRCQVCRGATQVQGDDFDAMNSFLAVHRGCAEDDGPREPGEGRSGALWPGSGPQ